MGSLGCIRSWTELLSENRGAWLCVGCSWDDVLELLFSRRAVIVPRAAA